MNTNNAPTHCHKCNAKLDDVPDIGMVCPNRACDVLDGPFSFDEKPVQFASTQPQANTNNAPEIVLEPMWNVDVGPCFAVKGKDWLPADKMRDIAAFLNHALQTELSDIQPAAVSADAVELARWIENYIRSNIKPVAGMVWNFSEGYVAKHIQAYGDDCRLDGARKGLTAAGNAAHECGYYSQAYVDDEPPMEVVHHNTGVWKARDAIRALSPETVCGGE